MVVTISCQPPTIQRPESVNNLCGSSVHYTAMNCIVLFLHWVLRGLCFQSVLVYNITNMHAMSHRSDFFCFYLYCQCLRTPIVLNYNVSFGSPSSRITQLSKSYPDVRFNSVPYLIAKGYDPVYKWMGLCSWFERSYMANHVWCLVGVNECKFGMSNCLQ